MTDGATTDAQPASERPFFERAPVSEVALALYFMPGLPLRTVDVGALWQRWKERFPRTEDHPPLPPVLLETFPKSILTGLLQFSPPPGSRTWFVTNSGEMVVQLQGDRLVLNWRRLNRGSDYPRYGTLRPLFRRIVADLEEVLASLGHPAPTIAQAEVTYINAIPTTSLADIPTATDLLAAWTGTNSDDFLPPPETTTFSAAYVIPGADGSPVGRLYVELANGFGNPVVEAPPEPLITLQLYARGRPAMPQIDPSFDFLDVAHRWVVNGFRSLTSQSMHRT